MRRGMLAVGLVVLLVAVVPIRPAEAAPRQAAPRPVLVVEGTGSQQWAADLSIWLGLAFLVGRLRADGYEPVVYSLPGGGSGDMRTTAAAVGAKVEEVLDRTGASRLDVIGHSQGGLVTRYYIKYLGGDRTVRHLVSLATPHYGSKVANLAMLFGILNCVGLTFCQQAAVGSPFLNELNAGDDTIGDVRYTNFGTVLDEIVVPYTNSFLANDGNNTNVTVQSQCPLRVVEHLLMPYDGAVYSGVQDALAGRPITLDCLAGALLLL